MMQIVKCKNCGSASKGFGVTSVTVNYRKYTKCCEHCNNIRTDEYYDYFCCEDCFESWMKDKTAEIVGYTG